MDKPEVKYELHKPATWQQFEGEQDGKIVRVHPYGHSEKLIDKDDRTTMEITVDCPFCGAGARANAWLFHRGEVYCQKCGARHWQYRSTVPVNTKPLTKKQNLFKALSGI